MKFSVYKQKVMHVGKNNPWIHYKVMGSELTIMTKKCILNENISSGLRSHQEKRKK